MRKEGRGERGKPRPYLRCFSYNLRTNNAKIRVDSRLEEITGGLLIGWSMRSVNPFPHTLANLKQL